MSSQDFNALHLHDAILQSVALNWELKACRFDLRAFAKPGENATPHVLEFTGVSLLAAPHVEAWGPSSAVLSCSQSSGSFFITMQSGDIIEVAARGYTYAAA